MTTKPVKEWHDKVLVTLDPEAVTPATLTAFAKLAEAVTKAVGVETYVEHTYSGMTVWRAEFDDEKAARETREAEYEARRADKENV